MAAHRVLDGVVWYRRRNSVLLSAGAADGRYENHRGGESRRGVGGYGIHGNGRGVAAGDRDCAGVHGGISAVFTVAGLVDGAICAGGVLLVAGGVAADADAGFGNRGRGQRVTAAGGISAVLPLVVCAGVASIYRGAGDFLFNGDEAVTARLNEAFLISKGDRPLGAARTPMGCAGIARFHAGARAAIGFGRGGSSSLRVGP